ncbi:transposase family protein (plasmid) [Streptomyces globisporus]|uniref:transposase family protein n=1 Tax=Streptomyces globisporus TaxID=1908 RepID=UPI002F90A4A1|nr:transposase family protein [Streptomyces globisporus]WSU86660.1 transposase family protein [Streptomyces globisporus]
MSWNVTTGWATGRLDGLVVRVHRVFVVDPDPSAVPGRMWSLGLCKSVVLVLFLLRQNPVEEAAAELFGISRATVSRRWTALLPVVEKVLAAHVPAPAEASAGRIVLIDGTLVTTWDRASEGTTMFSGKHRDTGFNLQLTATLAAGRLAVSEPAPGSRHDMHAWRPSGFPEAFTEREGMGDLGYVGSGLLTPKHKPPGQERSAGGREANRSVNTLRAAAEQAIAHLKDWKTSATRYRNPLTRFTLVAKTITALPFHKKG